VSTVSVNEGQYQKWCVIVCDLWREAEGGWSENGVIRHEYILDIPVRYKDCTAAMLMKRKAGITGWRADSWAGTDFCWRNGTMGAYAYPVT
jgi:D-arabinose 1-dehydrogenase-like Zn-dependent alcohol dehydrogenase